MTMKVLKINSSARYERSFSRELVEEMVTKYKTDNFEVIDRDLAKGVSLLSEKHIQAFYTPAEQRTPEQESLLEESNQLVDEVVSADVIIVGVPIYNFGVPANLKAWADLVSRVGMTFSYTDQGPVGLISDKPVYLIMTSGGTQVNSDIDFASTWLTHFFSFIGINNVKIIDSGQIMVKGEDIVSQAKEYIEQIQI